MTDLFNMIYRHRLRVLTLGLWLVIFVVARTYMVINDLTLIELAESILGILRDTWYGPLLYILLYVLRPLLLIPGTVLTLSAGLAYGLAWGIPISITANIISASVTYSVARWLMSSHIELDGRRGQFINLMRRNPFEAVLTMQLSYISLDLTCLLAGVLHLPFRPFLLGIAIGGSVGNMLGVIIGSSFEGSLAEGTVSVQPEMIALSLTIFVISLSISAFLRRRQRID